MDNERLAERLEEIFDLIPRMQSVYSRTGLADEAKTLMWEHRTQIVATLKMSHAQNSKNEVKP